jgi:hypothetical protein
MKTTLIMALSIVALLAVCKSPAAEISSNASPLVARVLEKNIRADEIGLKYGTNNQPIISNDTPSTCLLRNPLDELRSVITREVERDYIDKNNLKATDEEIREFQEFQDRFMAQDRIRRQKRLVELEEKLKDPKLSPSERERDEKSRATILSLAKHEKQLDQMGMKLPESQYRSVAGPWVEGWKFNKSIYEKYGGTVSITKFGPDPVGATKSLLEEYEKEGNVLVFDENLRSNFWKRLALPPQITAKPEDIDFVPYWKKPIPENKE